MKLPLTDGFGYNRVFALPNGDLIRGTTGPLMQIWDVKTGYIKRNLTSNNYMNPWLFGLLSNGDLIVGYKYRKIFIIWDLNEGIDEPMKRIIQTNDSFSCLTILNNDDLVVGQTFNSNFDIVIRDSKNGLIKQTLVGHTNDVYQTLVLPNQNLISASYDKTIKIWDLSTGQILKSFLHTSHVYSMAILKNGNLVSGLYDGTIHIWDLNSGDLIRSLNGHTNAICWNNCLQVLNNGDLLSASFDKSIVIWNSDNGQIKKIINEHISQLYQLTFLSSTNLVSVSASEVFIWS